MIVLDCAGRTLDLSRPSVMGILNVTPDSFSDGGVFVALDQSLKRAREMAEEGATIIDVGGESTRPGARLVGEQEELDRVIPVISAIAGELPVTISIDTSKPLVMREAAAAGAGMINDVMGLRMPGAIEAAAEIGLPTCLMHMQGSPGSMQKSPRYEDVVEDLMDFFSARLKACEEAGLSRDRLLLDPGFGFGKTLAHNLSLLKHLPRFADMGLPLLVGISRKSMIGALLDDRPTEGRLYGSLAAAVVAVERGASVIRTHDVKPTVDALRIVSAVCEAE